MDNYLINRETLGKFVDELIKNKALPVDNVAELDAQREAAIAALDRKIGLAIFGSLTDEQNAEFQQILEQGDDSEATYEEFFTRAGLNLDQIITNATQEFAAEFIGGTNA